MTLHADLLSLASRETCDHGNWMGRKVLSESKPMGHTTSTTGPYNLQK